MCSFGRAPISQEADTCPEAGFLGEVGFGGLAGFGVGRIQESVDRRGHSDAWKQFLPLGSFSPAQDHWLLLPRETIYLLPSLPSRPLPSFPGTPFVAHALALTPCPVSLAVRCGHVPNLGQ